MNVTASAHVEDDKLTFTVPAVPAAVAACVGEKLNANIRENLRVWRDAPGEHYTRIDADVQTSVTVELPR